MARILRGHPCHCAQSLVLFSRKLGTSTADSGEDAVPAWAIGPFTRELNGEPILTPRADTRFTCPVSKRTVAWEEKDVFNPAAVVKDGLVHLIYRAEDSVGRFAGTSRIGLATSRDGRQFEAACATGAVSGQRRAPAIRMGRRVRDPRVVETEDGRYVMTYTGYDGKTARLCVATSSDLVTWTKNGPAFAKAGGGRFRDRWSSPAHRVRAARGPSRRSANRQAILDVPGRHGHLSRQVRRPRWSGRRSSDVSRRSAGGAAAAITPRRHRFDSALVEPGPPAIVTPRGILLL